VKVSNGNNTGDSSVLYDLLLTKSVKSADLKNPANILIEKKGTNIIDGQDYKMENIKKPHRAKRTAGLI